jgi:hypothetical protein
MHCRDATASSFVAKFGVNSSHIFTVTVKCHICGIGCLACKGEFFVNLLDVGENYEHALDFVLHFPLGGLLLYFRATTVNPARHR